MNEFRWSVGTLQWKRNKLEVTGLFPVQKRQLGIGLSWSFSVLLQACNQQAVEQLSISGAATIGPDGVENGSPSQGNQNSQQFNGPGGLRKRGSYHSRQGSNFSEMQQLNLQVADLKNKLTNQDSEMWVDSTKFHVNLMISKYIVLKHLVFQ